MALSLKQKRFADEYLISGSALDAARKAGYSEKYAIYVEREEGEKAMQIKIDIDDKELREEVTNIIARKLTQTWSSERNVLKRTIADAVKEVVYSEKEFIIEMVINRATAEITKKAMPKLLSKLTD